MVENRSIASLLRTVYVRGYLPSPATSPTVSSYVRFRFPTLGDDEILRARTVGEWWHTSKRHPSHRTGRPGIPVRNWTKGEVRCMQIWGRYAYFRFIYMFPFAFSYTFNSSVDSSQLGEGLLPPSRNTVYVRLLKLELRYNVFYKTSMSRFIKVWWKRNNSLRTNTLMSYFSLSSSLDKQESHNKIRETDFVVDLVSV